MKKILHKGSSCWVRDHVLEAGALVDGKSYYSMFYEAAQRAEKYILLSGWQFDSKVELLRGPEAANATAPTTLLAFLNHLCETKPDLRIYVLAWDYSVVFALEREWLQKIAFDWMAHERVKFAFDKCVPLEGSHHQKFVVIDGVFGFVGGTDICDHRWDDRRHALDNPARFNIEGETYAPYHEVQGFLSGPAVGHLVEFFEDRWTKADAAPLQLAPRTTPWVTPAHEGIALPAVDAALCRTAVNGAKPCHDIREMYERAIDAAERSIYIESQYLTSQAVADAIVARFEAPGRPKLDVVVVLPVEPEAPKEELAMGVLQARTIKRIEDVAARTGHRLGVYSTVAVDQNGEEVATYIHSKLIIVDDRFLSFGSANLSNRSMGVDTELNIAFETRSTETRLGRAIRRLRVSLLAEHVGAPFTLLRGLVLTEGLVDRLESIADGKTLRLRRYVPIDPSESAAIMDALHASVGQYLDPERPRLQEDLEEPERLWGIITRGFEAFRRHAS